MKSSQKVPDLCITDGFVHKSIGFRSGDEILDNNTWQLWVPTELKHFLVTAAHCSLSAGQGSIHKTLQKLRRRIIGKE